MKVLGNYIIIMDVRCIRDVYGIYKGCIKDIYGMT